MEKGWIAISRQIQNSWIWEKPFSRGQAWIDLILLANYENKKIPYKNEVITCHRGDVNLSIQFLADKWGWDRKTVRNYLKLLESDGMVAVKCTTHRTTITLINYDNFQIPVTTKSTTKSQQDGQQSPITNKDNKLNNIIKPNKFNQFEKQNYDMEALKEMLEI